MKFNCITEYRAGLGESPIWSKDENRVYWIDILEPKILCTDISNNKTHHWKMPSPVGMIAQRKSGGLIVALEDGIYGFDPSNGEISLLVNLEKAHKNNRPNDGKCDVKGRLWIGTMNNLDSMEASGAFYRVSPSLKIYKVDSQLKIPNGLAWSPDNRVMYHTDTRSDMVYAYDFQPSNGLKLKKRKFFSYSRDKTGGVDGAAMDVEGGYWAALYGGGKLVRIMPDGFIEKEIILPVTQPTMPAFGGVDMKTIFITTAKQKLGAKELFSQPLAGGLLSVKVDVPGHPVYSFAG